MFGNIGLNKTALKELFYHFFVFLDKNEQLMLAVDDDDDERVEF